MAPRYMPTRTFEERSRREIAGERVRAELVQQDFEPRSVGGRKKQDKPIVVEYRWPGCPIKARRQWSTFRRYASTEIAEREIASQMRKHPSSEYRIRP